MDHFLSLYFPGSFCFQGKCQPTVVFCLISHHSSKPLLLVIFREKTLSAGLNVLLECAPIHGSDLCLTILDGTLAQGMRMIPRRPANSFAFPFQIII